MNEITDIVKVQEKGKHLNNLEKYHIQDVPKKMYTHYNMEY
jgi:hypothetical protein